MQHQRAKRHAGCGDPAWMSPDVGCKKLNLKETVNAYASCRGLRTLSAGTWINRQWARDWKWKSLCCVWLFATPRLYSPWNSPDQITGVGSLSLGTQLSQEAAAFSSPSLFPVQTWGKCLDSRPCSRLKFSGPRICWGNEKMSFQMNLISQP